MTSISTDKAKLDRDLVHRFLARESYWARSRSRDENDRIIERSLCFGAYDGDGRQIGYARVVSDSAAFAYIGDVFVVPQARGRGIGKALMTAILEHPEVRDVRRMALVTDDAHGLYAAFGFQALDDVEKWMQRRRPT